MPYFALKADIDSNIKYQKILIIKTRLNFWNILLKIKDTPEELARVSRKLSENDMDIHALTMIQQNEGTTIVAIVTDRNSKAKDILDDIMVK